jgi:hypothetical protein
MAITRITIGENSSPQARSGIGDVVSSNRRLPGGQLERPRYNSTRGFELCCSAVQLGRFVPENLHRLIELLNLQWLLQNRDRTNLKNLIEDLAILASADRFLATILRYSHQIFGGGQIYASRIRLWLVRTFPPVAPCASRFPSVTWRNC